MSLETTYSPEGRFARTEVLLVGADERLVAALAEELPDEFRIDLVPTIEAALERVTDDDCHCCLVVTQEAVERESGESLARLRATWTDLPVVLLTGEDPMERAVSPAAAGVDEFVDRPAATETPTLLAQQIRDAVEHHQALTLLAENRERHRSFVDDVLDEAVATAVYDAEGTLVWCNQEIGTLFGVETDRFVGRRLEDVLRTVLEDLFENPDRFAASYERAKQGDEETESEFHVLPGPDREERWVRHHTRPITSGLYAGGWVSTYTDLTDRKRREQMLTALHRSTRELVRADSRDEVLTGVVEAATDVLGLSSVVVYLWDRQDNTLQPAEWSEDLAGQGIERPPDLDGPAWLGWRAFVDGDTRVVDDLHEVDTPMEEGPPFRSGLLVPIGNFGLIASGVSKPDAYADTDVDFAETLAANATAALERSEVDRKLRDQAAKLDDRSDELRHLERTNEIVRSVDRAIVEASTHEEIERAVTHVLAEVGSYDFVWVGNRDCGDDSFTPRVWAGEVGSGFLDELDEDLPVEPSFPSVRAVETGEPQVVPDILSYGSDAEWRRATLSHGFNSLACIPLSYRGVVYGVLGIASKRSHAFDDQRLDVLRDVGRTVANAIAGVARKNALLGVDRLTELEFELGDTSGYGTLVRIADRFDTRVTVTTLTSAVDQGYLVHLAVDGVAATRVTEYLEEARSANSVRVVREMPETCVIEAAISDLGIVGAVTEHGATIRFVEASTSTARMVVGVPPVTDKRVVVEVVCDGERSASLVAVRDSSTEQRLQSGLSTELDDRLTDRQQDVLETAYTGGYFEWPRDQTGEELGAQLGIASPTFHQHLREAMRRLLVTVYECESSTDEE